MQKGMQCRRSLLAWHAIHLNPRSPKQNRARSCRSGVIRSDACFLGLDFGTSGGRAIVIDGEFDASLYCCWCSMHSCSHSCHAESGAVVTEAKQAYGLVRDGKGWQDCLEGLMAVLPQEVKSRIQVSAHLHAGIKQAVLCLVCLAILGSVQAVAVDGTSSTALLVDANTWDFLADAKMYFEAEDEQSVASVQVS